MVNNLIMKTPQSASEEGLSVYPHVLYERSLDSKLVLKLTDSLTLNLQKSSVLADEILLVTKSETLTEHSKVNTSAIQERLYHDPHHQSSLLVREKDGALHVEGVVNSKLRIKPLPERPRSSQGQVLHRMYEVDEGHENLMRMASTPRMSTTDMFVVEVHVVSCKQHQAHFKTNADLIAYLAVTVNAVNMRYLDMANPRISFKLVAITRSLDDKFVKRARGATVHATDTLQALATYYSTGHIEGKQDVVYFMTGQDLAMVQNGQLDKGLLGYAYIGTVCTYRGVAVGEDMALSYSGVLCMAHELAHSLGATHDTTPECPWSAGFLMSYVDGGTNRHRLSHCSERQIRITVRTLTRTCIWETSNSNLGGNNTHMPGQKINEEDYCNMLFQRQKLPVKLKAQKLAPEVEYVIMAAVSARSA
ncbi:venom metalloproteinase BumaMPs1-like [Haemaphysalis longicornis]